MSASLKQKLKKDHPTHLGALSAFERDYAWTAEQNGITSNNRLTIRWRLLHLKHRYMQRPSWMSSVTKTARRDNQTGQILVSVSGHSQADLPLNTTRICCNSLVWADATPLFERHTLNDPNRLELAKPDLEPCLRNRPLGTLASLPAQTLILCRPSCGHEPSSRRCLITSTDDRCKYQTNLGRLSSRGNWLSLPN